MSLKKVSKHAGVLRIGSLYGRMAGTVIALCILCTVVRHGWALFRADRAVRPNHAIGDYHRAMQYYSGNAKFWLIRGRMFHYSVDAPDPIRAAQDFRKALSLNPYLDRAWLDLADYLEQTGRNKEAEAALDNAIRVHRYSPMVHWTAGNYFLRTGNLPRMYDSFKTAVAYDIGKLGIAIQTAWNVDVDRKGILQKLIPDTRSANAVYFQYLISIGELDLARAAWERLLKNEVSEEERFHTSLSFDYIDALLKAERVTEAERVWIEALQKAGRYQERPKIKTPGRPDIDELVWNNSFEDELIGGGLGWSLTKTPHAKYEMERNNCMDGLKCLKIEFGGANLGMAHLIQIVPIPQPGNYVLEYNFRTDGLTTDQRPYFMVQEMSGNHPVVLQTSALPESAAWTVKSYNFTVAEGCRAVRVALKRNPSSKFDNKIKGTMWLDAVSIHAAPPR